MAMKKGCSCSILQTHKDVVTEIALHLPLTSLFRCRAVCKLWRDVIDSPSFTKLHIHIRSKEEEKDEKVYLQLSFDDFVGATIKLLKIDNGKSINLNLEFNDFPWPRIMLQEDISRLSTCVKGLICFNLRIRRFAQPLAICNPFLGQTKVLPFSPIYISSKCETLYRDVGIGCDKEFYKVVEVVYCRKHRCVHAHLYSRRSDSWRELGDQALRIVRPIDFYVSCNNGHFAHWYATTDSWWGFILTFDMKNEVFRTIKMPDVASILPDSRIVAMDGYSFILFALGYWGKSFVMIFESSICEEEGISKLSWNHVVDEEKFVLLPTPTPSSWRSDCVMWKNFHSHEANVFFYDYVARRFLGYFDLPAYSDIFPYKGSFISP